MHTVRQAVSAAQAVAAALRGGQRGALSHSSLHSSLRFLLIGTAAAAAPLFGFGETANAQQPPAQQAASPGGGQSQSQANQPQSIEEITVTGSRIRRKTDFDSPNPTTVVNASYLKNLGLVNVGDAVQQLPVNVSNDTPTTTGNANFFTGSTIANLRGLNPFFGSRTLTLVDSRRFVPTNQGDGVDLNFIPSILIDRVDTVTGGASAAYGSGAISGVQNIFMNRRLEGGRADVDGYETGHGDGLDRHVGVAYGLALGNDRGHFVVGYEAQNTDNIDCLSRDWCRKNEEMITGGDNTPSRVLASDVHANQISSTGVFNNGNTIASHTTQQLTPDGQHLTTFNIGQGYEYMNGSLQSIGIPPFPDTTASSPFNNVVGGDGVPIYEFTNLRAPIDRRVATSLFTWNLTDRTTMDFDLSYGRVKTTNITQALTDRFDVIHPDNAYLTPEVATAIAPAGPTFFNKDWTSQVDSHTTVDTKVKRAVLGFNGQFGESSWTWEGYYTYGKTNREQLVWDNRHSNAYAMAVDSVMVNGSPMCRVTQQIQQMGGSLTDPGDPSDPNSNYYVLKSAVAAAAGPGGAYADADPRIALGCVPLNPFGTQPITTAQHNYAFGYLDENLDYKQQVAAWDASGNIWKGLGDAGPFALAAGVELRQEIGHNIDSENDLNTGQPVPAWVHSDYLINYGETFAGKVDVSEAFAELNAPLLEDKPVAKRLEFNTAVRESRYRNTGLEGTTGQTRTHDFTTWKISGLWDPLDWLRVRGSRSRDMRAANFRELYYEQQLRAGGIFGYCGPAGSSQKDPCDWSLEGNVDLKPERADTTTLGLVFTPKEKAQGLRFAADYFKIEINDAIQQANVRRVLDGCQISHLQQFCDLIVPDSGAGPYASYDPNGAAGRGSGVQSIRALAFNGSGYSYKGIDFTGTYQLALGGESNLNLRLLATHMLEQKFEATPGAPYVDIVGQTGGANSFLSDNQPTADWVTNLSATWNHNNLNVTGQMRYVSSGVMNYYGITPSDPGYASAAPPLVTMSVNHVPSYQVYTLAGSYTFDLGDKTSMQLFGTIFNVFDKNPPFADGSTGGTNPVFFDTLGRAYRVGLRLTF